ncbi:MAG: hypothetical protein B7Z37_04145 [Verrucomicrobia bacterium 12-59-8]|nr:MAG: hypothetical protein B7Z37_04145 [Verrucomicrobia bacterium 12-59-8]
MFFLCATEQAGEGSKTFQKASFFIIRTQHFTKPRHAGLGFKSIYNELLPGKKLFSPMMING